MSISGLSFWFWRLLELITLIPVVGMLAYFVDAYTHLNALTPPSVLTLFIVSVLGAAWALGTLVLYARARHSAKFVAFVDLCFVGAFIAAVYELRRIGDRSCAHFVASREYVDLGVLGVLGANHWAVQVDKNCAMLKASWAFGIMNCIFFFITCLLALLVARHHRHHDTVVVKRETTHVSRHGSRRSHSRDYYHGSSPRRSHHSSRRTWV